MMDRYMSPREKQGLAECDDPDCFARLEPQTLAEYRVAVEHWRSHSYLGGCSHGC